MNYWLLKSEPSTWSWDDQSKVKKEMWDGVRNYQARNNLMKMKKGDLFFTPAMQEHMAYFLKHTHFLAFSTRKRTKFDYEKDLIRVNMKKYPDVKKAILKNRK